MNRENIYRTIVQDLKGLCLSNAPLKEIFDDFQEKILKQFKLHIHTDLTIVKAILGRLDSAFGKDNASKAFIDELKMANQLAKALKIFHFITMRGFRQISRAIENYEDSPNMKLNKALAYLRRVDNKKEFRLQFLIKIMGKEEDEEEGELNQYLENDDEIKKDYCLFWKGVIEKNIYAEQSLGFLYELFNRWENKVEMLSQENVTILDRKLYQFPGVNHGQVEINKELFSIAENNALRNESFILKRINNEVQYLEQILRRFSGLNIIKNNRLELRMGRFGSIVSGFACSDADLDLTVLTNSYIKQDEFLELLYDFLKGEFKEQDRRNGKRTAIELIINTQTPLIKISITNSNQRTVPLNTVSIDLLVNNVLGIINSKFLHVYSQVTWIRNLGILIKVWAKKSDLISKSRFSSYSFILMLIHFLIETNRANLILDNRRQLPGVPSFDYKRIKKGEVERFKVSYKFKTKPEDVTKTESVNYLLILTEFMKYYSKDIFQKSNKIVSVDGSERQIDPEFIYTIKDPFDRPHNPARVKEDNKNQVLQCLTATEATLATEDISKIRKLFC